MRYVLALLTALTLVPAHAQRIQSQAELDALLAPIALQPDGVLSQVLVAATRPEEVAAAATWSRANPHLSGDAAVRAVEQEPWDPAVKSLVAFPELLARMGESPQWVRELGEAFLAQQAQVMDTLQGLRQRAQTNGHLASSPQQTVYQDGEAIVVYPRSQIVYVQYYDPYVVYGSWWSPYYRPVYWRPWAPRPVFVSHFHSTPHWQHRRVHAHAHPPHRHPPANVRPYHRVPESRRQPIVQSMPAASAFSQQRHHVPRVQQQHGSQLRQANSVNHAPRMQQQGSQFRPSTTRHTPSMNHNPHRGGNQQGRRG